MLMMSIPCNAELTVLNGDEEIIKLYSKVSIAENSGFDIIMPRDGVIMGKSCGTLIKLGITMKMGEGYMLFPRSSLGFSSKIRLSNSIGLIDKGYTGELIACVDNLGDDFKYTMGARLFQLVRFDGKPIVIMNTNRQDISHTRGSGCFGSTGGVVDH